MATVKLATLAIRTIAKPISARLKQQAREHPFFRHICVNIAQRMYRYEMKLGTVVLGQPPVTIRPLSETKAIDNGANFIAESFLFAVAAGLIVAETWRSSNKESKRREGIADQLEDFSNRLDKLSEDVARIAKGMEERIDEERQRTDELARVLGTVVNIGLRGGWVEFEQTPLKVPQIQFVQDSDVREPTGIVHDQSSQVDAEATQQSTQNTRFERPTDDTKPDFPS